MNSVDAMVASPLTIVLFDLMDRRDARPPEKLFLTYLLGPSHARPGEQLPAAGQIANSSAATLWNALESAMRAGAALPKLNVSSLRQLWEDRHPGSPQSSVSVPPVSAVVLDPEPVVVPPAPLGRLAAELGDEDVALLDFVPSFVRPPPPLVPIAPDTSELRWIDPEPLHEVVWDPLMCASEGARTSDLRDLVAAALRSPLKEEQQQLVKAQLEAQPKLVFQCGVTPQNLPDLVHNNSVTATEVLLRLLASNQRADYFAALVNMDMSQNSMTVVNRLTSTVQLPAEFVHTYVSNCIRSCGKIPDRVGQVRMVRCFCLFLQSLLKSLIKSNHIDVQDLFIEVQAFCIEHSRYAELLVLAYKSPRY
jgi:CCR4-NOT transcription complex subunit 11